jgi:hypothetical protein
MYSFCYRSLNRLSQPLMLRAILSAHIPRYWNVAGERGSGHRIQNCLTYCCMHSILGFPLIKAMKNGVF